MKIFPLEKINIALHEHYIRTSPLNRARYNLTIEKNNDNYHHKDSIFNALIVGYKDDDMFKIRHHKLSIKRTGSYLLKEKFYKNTKKTPAPLIIFYEKKHGLIDLNKKLINDLYVDFNNLYHEFNDLLSKATNKKAISQHKIDYQKKIEHLAIGLFSNLERTTYPSTAIQGILLDSFFIGHKQGKFFIKSCTTFYAEEKNLSANKDDSLLIKEQFPAQPIPSNLNSKASGLIIDYKNNLQSKYDRTTTETAKVKIEKEINLTVSLHGALFNRNSTEFQCTLQALKKRNEEKHSKFKYKLLAKFHLKPKRVRMIENIEALTRQHSFSL